MNLAASSLRVCIGLCLLLIAARGAASENDYYCTAYIAVQATPVPQATLSWPALTGTQQVQIARRLLGQTGSASWSVIATQSAPSASYVDTGVASGQTYEYRVKRTDSAYQPTTFLIASVAAPLEDSRGAVLLVVDNTQSAALAPELARMELDLTGDGWEVVRMDMPRHGSGTPEALKAAIQAAVAAKPAINAVHLFGALPMVRSGWTAPDGHTPRAVETDTFYADLNGTWTDTSINQPGDGGAETSNIPGDGKYDQSSYPSALELMVGRTTFHSLSKFRKGEQEYLRDYIHKGYAWRHGHRAIPYRSLYQPYETPAHLYNARNWMRGAFGLAGVTQDRWANVLQTQPHLWAAGFAAGGVDDNEFGLHIGQNLQALFFLNFRSYKHKFWTTDNGMRSTMAQPDWGLNCVWGGRPNWFFHHVAAGKPIGYAAQRTQNTAFNGFEYGPEIYSGYSRGVHLNLMGDPTFRMHPVLPPGAVTVGRAGATANLSWTASAAADLQGYHVYRATARLGPYTRLTGAPIAAVTYADTAAPAGTVWYQVRAVARTTVPTGTFLNQSQGRFGLLRPDGTCNQPPTALPGSLTVKSNSPGWFAFQGSDPDGDALTPIVLQNPANGQLRWQGGQAFYVSKADFIGSDSFIFALSDGVHVSAPATISVTVDAAGETLLAWEAPDVSGTPATDATYVATNMQSSTVGYGSGSPYTNPWNYIDQLLVRSLNVASLGTTKYLSWTAAPAAGYRQSLSRVTFFLMGSSSNVIHAELRSSLDGYTAAIPLQAGETTGNRAIHTADLSGIAGLQSTTAAVQFRLYLWMPTSTTSNDAAGFGRSNDKPADKIEDLVVQGTVVPDGGGPPNAPPVIANVDPESLTTLEDTVGSLVLGASDADGHTLTWSVLTQGAKGVAAVSGTGNSKTVNYTPNANANGADSFVVRVSDGQGGTDQITVNVTITPVNDVPSFVKGANQTVLEDSGARTVSGWATALSKGPADEAGQTLSFTVTNTNNALFSVQPAVASNGTLTFTPAANANGTATVSVSISDDGGTADGGVDTSLAQTFTIAVTSVNDAPSFVKGADQTVAEDSGARTVAGWATAISKGPANEGSQVLTFTVTAATPSLFSVQPAVASNGTLTFTPALDAYGTTTVSVYVRDDGGTVNGGIDQSAAQVFSITITAVNDAPVVAVPIPDQTAVVSTLYSYVIPAGTVTDVDGPALTWSAAGLPAWLGFTPATRTFSGTPTGADVGSSTITVTASDGSLSAVDSFVLTVQVAVNTAPVILTGKPASLSTLEDTDGLLSLNAFDADGDLMTWTILTQGSLGTATVSAPGPSCTLTYTPNANANGADTVEVQVSDGKGGSDLILVNVTITAVNDAPAFLKGANQTVAEDAGAQTVAGWATGMSAGPPDEVGQALSFVVTAAVPGRFSVQPAVAADGTLTYTPAADATGTTTISVRLRDDGGTANGGVDQSAAQTFTITLTAANDAPVLVTAIPDQTAEIPLAFSYTVPAGTFADVDGDPLTWSASGLPAWLTFTPATRIFSGTPDAGDEGVATLTVTVSDGSLTASTTFELTVAPAVANTPPVITTPAPASLATLEDTPGTTVLSATDADGDTLTWTIQTQGTKGTAVTSGTGASTTITYTPNAHLNGSDSLVVRVTDEYGGTATIAVHVTITAVNDPPDFIKGADQTVLEDAGAQSVAGWATGFTTGPADEAAQSWSFTVSTADPTLFSVQPAISASGTLSYTPAADANGTTTVTVTMIDSGGTANGGDNTSSSESFTITLTAVPDAPQVAIAQPDRMVAPDTFFLYQIPAGTLVDADGDPLTWTTSALPAWLGWDPATRTLQGTPTVADLGSTLITVTATDPDANAGSFSFLLTVGNVAPPAPGARGVNPAGTGNSGACGSGGALAGLLLALGLLPLRRRRR